MTTENDKSRADFEAWAATEYRHATNYTKRDFRHGLEAWQARQAEIDTLRRENSMLKTYEIGGLTLGEKFTGRISEAEAVELVNCIIRAQRDEALRGNQEV